MNICFLKRLIEDPLYALGISKIKKGTVIRAKHFDGRKFTDYAVQEIATSSELGGKNRKERRKIRAMKTL